MTVKTYEYDMTKYVVNVPLAWKTNKHKILQRHSTFTVLDYSELNMTH